MKRTRAWRVSTIAVGTAGLIAALVSLAGTANAAGICGPGDVCVYQDPGYSGRVISQGAVENRPDIGSYMNDRTSAVKNRSDYKICFYINTKYEGGLTLELKPHESKDNLSSIKDPPGHPSVDDSISSWRRSRHGKCPQ